MGELGSSSTHAAGSPVEIREAPQNHPQWSRSFPVPVHSAHGRESVRVSATIDWEATYNPLSSMASDPLQGRSARPSTTRSAAFVRQLSRKQGCLLVRRARALGAHPNQDHTTLCAPGSADPAERRRGGLRLSAGSAIILTRSSDLQTKRLDSYQKQQWSQYAYMTICKKRC